MRYARRREPVVDAVAVHVAGRTDQASPLLVFVDAIGARKLAAACARQQESRAADFAGNLCAAGTDHDVGLAVVVLVADGLDALAEAGVLAGAVDRPQHSAL